MELRAEKQERSSGEVHMIRGRPQVGWHGGNRGNPDSGDLRDDGGKYKVGIGLSWERMESNVIAAVNLDTF